MSHFGTFDTIDFMLENYLFNTGNIHSMIGQIVTEFYRIFNIQMNSLSFSCQNLVNPNPIEWPIHNVFTNKHGKKQCWPRNYEYLWIFTNIYEYLWILMNIYESLQIVWSHFFTNMLLFVNIRSKSNIYWFISIRIRCQRIQTNSYSFTFDYS